MNTRVTKEEIAERIKNNIEMKRIMSNNFDIDNGEEIKKDNIDVLNFERNDMSRDYKLVNENWYVDINKIPITSQKPVAGKFVAFAKRAVRKLTYWLYSPLFDKITEFNSGVARILNEQSRCMDYCFETINDLNNKLEETNKIAAEVEYLKSDIENLERHLTQEVDEVENLKKHVEIIESNLHPDIRKDIHKLENRLEEMMNAFVPREKIEFLEDKINELRSSPNAINGDNIDIDYLAFENKFRGSREQIKERQSLYLDYINSTYKAVGDGIILDIGAGRGEMLELLREHNIPSRGVDINQELVDYCRQMGLVCEKRDALHYIRNIENNLLAGVTAFQVVEHMTPKKMINLINISYQKLKTGGIIILETGNPNTFAAWKNFYIDLTHKKPVPPETLKYLLEAAGFNGVEIKYSACVTEENRLDGEDENTIKLNDTLFGYQDYAVVGWK